MLHFLYRCDILLFEVKEMKRDYNKIMEEQIQSFDGEKPRILLHSCCAPCTSSVLERLYENFNVTLFYFNPNTHPFEEYKKRGDELPKLLKASGMTDVEIIYGEYNPDIFFQYAKGLENAPEGGERCTKCFELRLSETAKMADKLGFDMFGTTLTVSPHKNAELINSIGTGLGASVKSNWLYSDFKKKNGYLRSIELSKKYEIYRQCYCGCVYSMPEGINC
jgi:hypothetical protein